MDLEQFFTMVNVQEEQFAAHLAERFDIDDTLAVLSEVTHYRAELMTLIAVTNGAAPTEAAADPGVIHEEDGKISISIPGK